MSQKTNKKIITIIDFFGYYHNYRYFHPLIRFRFKIRKRFFSLVYLLLTVAFGVGDESVQWSNDGCYVYTTFIFLMAMFYTLALCHLSGYVSAYYSIRTGNRVQTTSWLKVRNKKVQLNPPLTAPPVMEIRL